MSVGIKNPELYARMKALIDKAMALMQPDLKEAWEIKNLKSNTSILDEPAISSYVRARDIKSPTH